MKRIINSKLIPNTIFIIILLLFSFMLSIKSHFFVVDDNIMNRIAGGDYSVEPNEHLVFINAILGKVFKLMYSLIESVNWFLIWYILLMIFCAVILYVILNNHINRWLSLLISSILALFIIHYFTFTSFGFICTMLGILGIVEYFPRIKEKSINYKINLLFSVSLLFIGQMMREKAWIVSILINLPIIFVFLKNNRYIKKKIILLAIGVVVISSLIKMFNLYSYSNDFYSEYKAYSEARANVVDYPIKEYSKKDYDLLGLSKNDYKCIKGVNNQTSYLIADKEVFSKTKLKKIHQMSPKYNICFFDWVKKMISYKQSIFCFVFGVLLLLSDTGKRKLFYLIEMLLVYSAVLLLFVIQRYEPKVFVNIFFVGIISSLFFYFYNNGIKSVKKIIIILLTIVLIIYGERMCFGVWEGYNTCKKTFSEGKYVREYIASNKRKLFVLHNTKINDCYYRLNRGTFEKPEKMENVMALFDWNSYLNDYYYKIKRYKIKDPNSLLKGLLNKSVFYISKKNDNQERIIIKTFLNEHTKESSVGYRKVSTIKNTDYCVYKYYYQ